VKNFIKHYFDFSKQERRGILTLLLFIVAISFLPKAFPYFIKPKVQNTSAFEKDIARLVLKQQDSSHNFYATNYDNENFNQYNQPNYKNYVIKGELFYFDPNTISGADWKRLGVRDKTIATIQNYLSKGGKFYKPEDIGKIWGFFPNEVDRLLPYVQIDESKLSKPSNYANPSYPQKTYETKTYTPSVVDVNHADTAAFIALPGIGSKLANRIVNYREKLGGFYKVEQIKETFGLQDSTFQKIKDRLVLSTKAVTQININTATMEELKAHPYLKQNLAKVIFNYRTQHGNYQTLTDLKKIMIIDEETFAKISPYLTIQ
jgi:competence protein ComEA